ncbi:Mini-ribonuclease 3 [Lactobacillus mellis]|uniref:Mini-ribonuclease 3 n=1 Tax=Bombilactobacillus mellis TaxID=1218508 RepID=UPI0015803199|nr:Mini-ribonuclease 3 [Bombilactobacillus mellis]MCT6840773.1 Mini-ribonuclease 3 [Bombilactobacillus mellis]MCT6857470.1 Mini-ribonuclease 3 [Bombilactobacillus mellis]MCT6872680.1 Mini-ribonuclease 3 [Bombilactobacillus mellis]MCX0279758.1 Mini-ribonuclease 3 [Bombilactobacillus mellis]NUG39241.1 Mini-ribonuclease 3 [Bombilactobacillus mellis]
MRDYQQFNGLTLAYLGDAVWEVFVRDHLLANGLTKVNLLQKRATHFVSAKAQAALIELMRQDHFWTETEADVFRRGRNAKAKTHAKNTSVQTYNISTGFEAIFGYLQISEQHQRLQELAAWCIQQVEMGRTNEFHFQ